MLPALDVQIQGLPETPLAARALTHGLGCRGPCGNLARH